MIFLQWNHGVEVVDSTFACNSSCHEYTKLKWSGSHGIKVRNNIGDQTRYLKWEMKLIKEYKPMQCNFVMYSWYTVLWYLALIH